MTEGGAHRVSHDYSNHLIDESSPYLLMHAHNPVDWYPWGQEAFDLAKRENKPIFLSVGYSTCHWCHVMERESFTDPEIARIMNADFVNIKVDREERPDVDKVYMTFVQATTGSGGWPMSVFLTPDLKPFFGGTYWPPVDRYGRPGFSTVLERVAEAWKKDSARIEQSAAEVLEQLEKSANAPAPEKANFTDETLSTAYRQIKSGYDPANGGFGGAPKFPRPVVFNFLLRHYARTGGQPALQMTLHTLHAMAEGGIHDHLGGGFHRYSVDAKWHVPHFEKMLYDQAQLAITYIEAYQITHDPFYADTARDILGYVLRDMHSAQGGFFSAEDADSQIEKNKPEHGEGAFYLWTADQIEEVLGPDAAAIFGYAYDVKHDGNVASQNDPQGEFAGKNILQVAYSVKETAKHFDKPQEEIRAALADARSKLLAARNQRPRPPLDDKILTSWNGLMISAFARAGQALGEPAYVQAAQGAADFIQSRLYNAHDGTLKRRYRKGDVGISGFLDDYTGLVQGLLDLYEASFRVSDLAWAIHLQETQDRLFWNEQGGGYFQTSPGDKSILVRMRDAYDGAEPSPNSVAAMNLLRLAEMANRPAWRERADKIFLAFSRQIEHSPETLPQMISAVDFALSKSKQVVIAGDRARQDTQALLDVVNQRYLPNKILLLVDGADGKQLAGWLPFIEGMHPIGGKATAYVCENYACKLPTSDPAEVARLLDEKP
ncbi:MAG: thioredoxin domain-containing protein [Acidobacteria bacterium]|nr:MAG: thioredoxin domain-containing protein [Acidobacteriota bacterium]